MSSRKPAVRRHRTLWISDVHLGSEGCKARALVEFLRQNECENLYLVGDIFDGWKLRAKFYWPPDHSRVLHAVIAKARKGTKVHYIAGNHDDFLRQFVRKQLRLGRIRLANEAVHTTADGRRLLVIHGDVFDEVVSNMPLLAHASDLAYTLLMRADTAWQRWNGVAEPMPKLSAMVKTQVKSVTQYLSGVDEKMLHRCRNEGLNGVVTGHTHHAEVRYVRNGVTSFNCGDWVESCTALAEDFQGEIRILKWEPTKKPAPRRKAVAKPRKPAARSTRRRVAEPIKRVVARVRARRAKAKTPE
ncbi:UDP-2,3-diacylglucosamine diphosphatase [Solimonas sp. K1W22B-7]|uniref:UDP-2,3-diacylglucosamine diphosphatase n=1 Tax=Solimonas sp. K1W22B-7 TaxID=2303331 RepID=UPI0013C45D4F|nr:UDP-2,3-diacylglucosamine diphosphatase [Solimonas sp. K1W22B-7]